MHWLILSLAMAGPSGYSVTLDGELLTESAVEMDGRLFVPANDLARCLEADLKSFPAEGRAELRQKSVGRGEAQTEGLKLVYEDHTTYRSDEEPGGHRIVVKMRVTNEADMTVKLFPELTRAQVHDQFGFSYSGTFEGFAPRDFFEMKPGESKRLTWSFDVAQISHPRLLVFRVESDRGLKSSQRPAVRMTIPERPIHK